MSTLAQLVDGLVGNALVESTEFEHSLSIVEHYLFDAEERSVGGTYAVGIACIGVGVVVFPYPESHLRSVPSLSLVVCAEVRLQAAYESLEVACRQTVIGFARNAGHKVDEFAVLCIVCVAPSSLIGCHIHLVRRTDGEIKTIVA